MNYLQFKYSPKAGGPSFPKRGTWRSWDVLDKAIHGIPMTEAWELELFEKCTGRKVPSPKGYREVYIAAGRRSGKSHNLAGQAVYAALFTNYQQHLSPGERGLVHIVASDRQQAGVILSYVKGILHGSPVLAQYIESELKESVDLSNGITVEVMSCSFRAIRGRTVCLALFDEASFWRSEGAAPDHEIRTAELPAMASIPNAKLLVASSPYARSGILYEAYRDYFGQDDDNVLVWKASTAVMNPTIDAEMIERELKRDPSGAKAEWLAEFRDDIETFLTLSAIEQCAVVPGELPPDAQTVYHGFVDPSGGRADAFTLCLAHSDRWTGKLVVDCLRGWQPPLNPESVVGEIKEVLKAYRVRRVVGDKYAGNWVSSAFDKVGITYLPAAKPKSDLYLHLESLVNTFRAEIPKHKQLITELVNLERRRSKSGKDAVDHPPRGSDDYANAVAGALYVLSTMEGSAFALCDLR